MGQEEEKFGSNFLESKISNIFFVFLNDPFYSIALIKLSNKKIKLSVLPKKWCIIF